MYLEKKVNLPETKIFLKVTEKKTYNTYCYEIFRYFKQY